MRVVEYGKNNTDTIVLLHGGGLSWWNYRKEAELLQHRYHVVLPILDGHADSDCDFISIEQNAKEIIAYIDRQFSGEVLLIGGLSLGGQILVEILTQKKDICRYAIIESALVKPMHITHMLIRPMIRMSYGLIKKPWFSKMQFQSLKIQKDLYEDYYRDTCKISENNMISFLEANSDFQIQPELCKNSAKVLIMVGAKEQRKMITSAKMLHEALENSSMCVLNGYDHGDCSLNHPDAYINQMNSLLQECM